MKLVTFEKLAELAIKRELSSRWHEVDGFKVSLSIVRTEIREKAFGRTVTVWFETRCDNPLFWDLMPVTIIYKGKQLSLGDICERTGRFFDIAVKRLQKRYCQQTAKGFIE
jgi:hypothetical protein